MTTLFDERTTTHDDTDCGPIFRSPSEHTMEGPYSARFPLSPTGEKSRRAPVFRRTAKDRTRSASGVTTMDGDPQFAHRPVMLDEVVATFAPVPAGTVIDATLGGGGHAAALLTAHRHLQVVGIDQDADARRAAGARLEPFGSRARIVAARFDALAEVAASIDGPVVGVLFDLGVSSHQLDTAERGFSYRLDAPLDMRMDTSRPLDAATVVNTYDVAALTSLLRTYGDERYASRIAAAIVAARPVRTTGELADLVRASIPAPARRTGGNPAKRTFQAIRIEVNDEFGALRTALDASLDVVAVGGRVAVLSYHSGEDRIVKQAFRSAETGDCTCRADLPCACGAMRRVRLVSRGGRTPSSEELAQNRRAESARLRVAERIEPEAVR